MNRKTREIIAEIEGHGFVVLDHRQRTHHVFKVRNQNDIVLTYTCAVSPYSRRQAKLNRTNVLRRLATIKY